MKKLLSICLATIAITSINAQETFSIDPAPGSTVEKLDKVTLTLLTDEDNEVYDYIDIDASEDVHFNFNGEYFCGVTSEQDWRDVAIMPTTPFTRNGEYTLVIGAYALGWGTYSPNDVYNSEELRYTFIFTGGIDEEVTESPYCFTANPTSGSTLDTFDGVTLTMRDDEDYVDYDYIDIDESADVHFNFNGEYYCGVTSQADYREVTIMPEKPFISSGEYSLVIGEYALGWGTWSPDDVYNDEPIELTYTYVAAPTAYTLEAEVSNNKELTIFTLTFPEGTRMVESAQATLANTEYEYSETADIVANEDDTFTVTFTNGPTHGGTYTFTIEQGMFGNEIFMLDNATGVANAKIEKDVMYMETGISTITVETAKKGVYNLLGVKVAESTEALQPGIYVVDGKKVIIR